jgi:uncharacterized protein (TIGR02147 family)
MNRAQVFSYKSYKLWMANLFADRENRGLLSRLARQIGCQRSYLSRVVNSELHLTPDFAFKISEALKFSEDEQAYFLTLVDWERSSSPEYRQFLSQKLQKMKANSEDLGVKTQRPAPSLDLNSTAYFTAWYWSAIHLWCSTKGSHTIDSVAKRFSLDPALVKLSLNALTQLGFIEKTSKGYKYKTGAMHLGKHSPWATLNHSHWRTKAVQNSALQDSHSDLNSIHFTNLQTMKLEDYHKILALMRTLIDRSQEIGRPSEPEELVSLCIDAFIVK